MFLGLPASALANEITRVMDLNFSALALCRRGEVTTALCELRRASLSHGSPPGGHQARPRVVNIANANGGADDVVDELRTGDVKTITCRAGLTVVMLSAFPAKNRHVCYAADVRTNPAVT